MDCGAPSRRLSEQPFGDSAVSAPEVENRLDRIERAIRALSWWLVEAQTGFGVHDARGIERILAGDGESADSANTSSHPRRDGLDKEQA